jgi:hypothetical protein
VFKHREEGEYTAAIVVSPRSGAGTFFSRQRAAGIDGGDCGGICGGFGGFGGGLLWF